MDIEGFGEKTVYKLSDAGILEDVGDHLLADPRGVVGTRFR